MRFSLAILGVALAPGFVAAAPLTAQDVSGFSTASGFAIGGTSLFEFGFQSGTLINRTDFANESLGRAERLRSELGEDGRAPFGVVEVRGSGEVGVSVT
jgi:hypothetical protein